MRKWLATGSLLLAFAAGAAAAPAASSPAVSLDECVIAALENSPDVQSAARRVESAQAMLKQAWSAYYPWVNLSANYARSDNPPQAFMMTLNQRSLNMMDPAFDPNNPDDTENLRGSVGLQWRLYDSGQRGATRNMARFGAEATAEALAAARNQLIHEVTRGFYGVLQAKAFLAVQSESVSSIEESLRVAQERFNAGSAVKTDVLNLETQLAQAREDLIRVRNGLQLAVAALNTAIGDSLATTDNLRAPDVSLDAPPPECKDPNAFENRPELKAARLMKKVKEQELKKAQRGYGPTLNAFASSDWDSDASSNFEQSYMVGVMADINVFDGFRTRGAIQQARADYEAAKADEQKAVNNLRLDLTQAFLGVRDAWERLDVTRKSVESAEEALRITQEQYQQGAADITILLTAQVGRTAMRTRNVAAQYDYLIALGNLERARGALVQRYVDDAKKSN